MISGKSWVFSETDILIQIIGGERQYQLEAETGESILLALERAGYKMRRSCLNGVCQICKAELLAGRIIQRYPELDVSLRDGQQPAKIYACTAIPQGDIRVKIDGLLGPGEFRVKKLVCDIASVEQLSHEVFRVRLHLPVTASQAVEFHAGQYLELILPDGRRAPFSIGSAPDHGSDLELHIRRMPDGELSIAMIDHIQNNPSIEIELPKGDCYLNAASLKPETRIVLVAASTGFSQIKSIAEHLLANQVSNPIHIYWGVRVAEDLYLDKLPEQWATEHANVSYELVVSEPENGQAWNGRTGLIPDAILADYDDFSDMVMYTSGSPGMVYALLDACEAKGFNGDYMHADVFAYAPRT
ncbi:FAD-binding oxidoreductase [Aliamphritea ceti]|uniref:FAD-binding oxidoreductase n=1 Tax=Aliamphritea ceti TaxID=1524258 RepID=UPI0021C48008|nr:FAD-binding oxidoreductase [Aliamphritea ceti]